MKQELKKKCYLRSEKAGGVVASRDCAAAIAVNRAFGVLRRLNDTVHEAHEEAVVDEAGGEFGVSAVDVFELKA